MNFLNKEREEERPAVVPLGLYDLGGCHILTAWGSWGVRAAKEPSLDL